MPRIRGVPLLLLEL